MSKQSLLLSDFRINFRLRDFLLDVLACLVPGLIFIIAISIIIGLLFVVLSFPLWSDLSWAKESVAQMFKDLVSSFSTQFWFANFLIFTAYFCGHALYRKTPEKPDYISFLRIRDKIFKSEETDDEEGTWVVEKDRGIVRDEVHFPYSNLNRYLESRGFTEFSKLIELGTKNEQEKTTQEASKQPDHQPNTTTDAAKEIDHKNKKTTRVDRQRSKSFINKWKIRLAFFYPEQIITLVRNEAHIRLASSVWYASEYIVRVSYFCNTVLILCLPVIVWNWGFLKNSNADRVFNSIIFIPKGSVNIIFIIAIVTYCLAIFFFIRGYLSIKAFELLTDRWIEIKKWIDIKEKFANPTRKEFSKYGKIIDSFLETTIILSKDLKKDLTDKIEKLTKRNADLFCSKLRLLSLRNDRGPMFCSVSLLVSTFFVLLAYSSFSNGELIEKQVLYLTYMTFYLILLTFILFGALFAKHRVEETIHYQRVREVYYVLETAHIAGITSEEALDKHRSLLNNRTQLE